MMLYPLAAPVVRLEKHYCGAWLSRESQPIVKMRAVGISDEEIQVLIAVDFASP
jgi:hypothetical protein